MQIQFQKLPLQNCNLHFFSTKIRFLGWNTLLSGPICKKCPEKRLQNSVTEVVSLIVKKRDKKGILRQLSVIEVL